MNAKHCHFVKANIQDFLSVNFIQIVILTSPPIDVLEGSVYVEIQVEHVQKRLEDPFVQRIMILPLLQQTQTQMLNVT